MTAGLISAAPGRRNGALQNSAKQVEGMVQAKMSTPEFIILCLEDSNDWSNATSRRMVMGVRPSALLLLVQLLLLVLLWQLLQLAGCGLRACVLLQVAACESVMRLVAEVPHWLKVRTWACHSKLTSKAVGIHCELTTLLLAWSE